MPPKRKAAVVEDTRSPVEISIDNTLAQIKQCENQIASFREGVQDLAVHSQRIKQLEQDIIPKETELKHLHQAYNRLMDSGVAMHNRGRPTTRSFDEPAVTDLPQSRAHSRAALSGANTPGGAQPSSPGDDADREALRHLSAVVRENMFTVLNPVFKKERTSLEALKEEHKEREAAEKAAAEAAQPNASAPPQPPVPSPKKSAPTPTKDAKSNMGASQPVVPIADRVDGDLYLPPGMDHGYFAELMKLRQTKVQVERAIKTCQQQLSQSRQIVARRTNEGASKPALKKAEKVLQGLHMQHKELLKQKDEYDARRRSEGVTGSNSQQKEEKKKGKK